MFIVAEETVERPGDIGARLFYKNKETIDVRDSEVACNMMEGGKSRDSYVDFICFFFIYMENRLVEGLCWAQNVLFGAKSVISELCFK